MPTVDRRGRVRKDELPATLQRSEATIWISPVRVIQLVPENRG
jgi:hypothetical protein